MISIYDRPNDVHKSNYRSPNDKPHTVYCKLNLKLGLLSYRYVLCWNIEVFKLECKLPFSTNLIIITWRVQNRQFIARIIWQLPYHLVLQQFSFANLIIFCSYKMYILCYTNIDKKKKRFWTVIMKKIQLTYILAVITIQLIQM